MWSLFWRGFLFFHFLFFYFFYFFYFFIFYFLFFLFFIFYFLFFVFIFLFFFIFYFLFFYFFIFLFFIYLFIYLFFYLFFFYFLFFIFSFFIFYFFILYFLMTSSLTPPTPPLFLSCHPPPIPPSFFPSCLADPSRTLADAFRRFSEGFPKMTSTSEIRSEGSHDVRLMRLSIFFVPSVNRYLVGRFSTTNQKPPFPKIFPKICRRCSPPIRSQEICDVIFGKYGLKGPTVLLIMYHNFLMHRQSLLLKVIACKAFYHALQV